MSSQLFEETTHQYLWSVAEFHKLAEAGIFTEDDRIELINGELIEMAPIGSDHVGHVNRLNHKFSAALRDRALVSVQNPIALGTDSEPQPDIALLRWRDDFYEKAHPSPDDVLLIIEVSDTTTDYDRNVKVPLYARHNISEVWLLDLQKQRLETYQHPVDGEYSRVEYHRQGQVSPEQLPEVVIELADLFSST